MVQTMTPCTQNIIDDEIESKIDKAVAIYRTVLMTNRSKFQSELTQKALGESRLSREMMGVLYRYLKTPTPPWREENGVIYFTLTTDGTTGEGWINRLEAKWFRMTEYAEKALRSPDFRPTNGMTIEIAVLKGDLYPDNQRIIKHIHADADKRMLSKPNMEIACLIRDTFSDEDIEAMGLRLISTMHEPITDSDGNPRLLTLGRGNGGLWLGLCFGLSGSKLDRDDGFAFVV